MHCKKTEAACPSDRRAASVITHARDFRISSNPAYVV